MAKSEVLTGDQISKQIAGRTDESNFADIAREMHTMMDHRPTKSGADLAAINDALHAQNILPGIEITGVQGQDFIGKNAAGATVRYDSSDLDHAKVDTTTDQHDINGRKASIAPDGSGSITTKPGDDGWTVANDVLKSQGNANPSNREIANYVLQLEHLNGKDKIHHLKPNQDLTLPPSLKGGDDTSFSSDRAIDTSKQISDKLTDSKTDLAKSVADAKQVIQDLHFDGFGWNANINQGEISTALQRPELTDDQRKSLLFLQNNFDQLKNTGAVLGPLAGTFGRGDSIWMGGLDQYQQTQEIALSTAALQRGM